ncbi:hypothetical protein IE994_09145 [Enterobacter hormaechei]|nr:hypothetical protein [Enterobacter hormaechei]
MLSWSRSIRLLFQNLLICLGCDYFNSGVLYVDARTWNENKISHKVFECLLERGADFKYFDQDALNVVLNEKIMFIDGKYNCQIKAGHKKEDFMREPPNETVLLHYVGSDKPWQLWNQQQISTYYRKYKKNVTLGVMLKMLVHVVRKN